MTENKWLDFAGFLNGCMYKLEHDDCPYRNYRKMDQYQRLEFLFLISDKQAAKIMNCCSQQQNKCTPTFIHSSKDGWASAEAI